MTPLSGTSSLLSLYRPQPTPQQPPNQPASEDRFTASQEQPFIPNRADMMRAAAGTNPLQRAWDTSGQFVRGVGDQVKDAWEAVTNPGETIDALKSLGKRVVNDPGGAARDAAQAGKELAEKVKSNSAEENSRLMGQNVPLPGVKQLAMLGAVVKISKGAKAAAKIAEHAGQAGKAEGKAQTTAEAYQRHLQKLEKESPDKLKHLDGQRPNAPGSEAFEREAAKAMKIQPNSKSIQELSPKQKSHLEDPKNSLDNPKAFTSDFNSNGIHVRPSDGKSHIQYQYKDGQLSTVSKDGATPGQQEAARLRLLSDPTFRNQLADQIRSGLERQPPKDPAALAHAEAFLKYLKALDYPH